MRDSESSNRWVRIQEVFADCKKLPLEERKAFLERECAGDPELEEEVSSLLAASGTADDFFTRLASRSGVPLAGGPDPSTRPRRVDRYRLLELLGRGGMGAVYLAERDDDEFSMRVALKLLPMGLDTDEARRRFRRERQFLAELQHPNIARLYDGGVTEDGTPYLVMEYVEGTRIDEFCDGERLGIPERLRLFLDVCVAVDVAHRSLIVHRDLKPQNIQVTKDGRVKLLDFGIAQALDREMAEGGTVSGVARPMTLAYASPEQIRGEAVTTVSDVYGLGILLYRLLVGLHPYPVPLDSPGNLERVITEADPSPPSQALNKSPDFSPGEGPTPEEIAASRNTTAPGLGRRLAGDLDRIVLMALRKEPERRYPSVMALAEDINRHLGGYPVSAQKDTLSYRLSRFASRHRAGVAVGAALSVSLMALAVTLVWFSLTTRAQSERIAREAETTAAVSAFLVDLFRVADPFEGLGDTLTVRSILDRGAEGLATDSTVAPDVRAHMMNVVGEVYMSLGLYVEAGTLFEESLELREATNGADDPSTADALEALAWSYQERGRFGEADSLLTRALSIHETSGADSLQLASTWAALARALREEEKADSAKNLAAAALALYRERLGPDHPETVGLMTSLAFMQRAAGDLDEADALYREALEIYAGAKDLGGRPAASAMNNFAFLLRETGNLQEAEAVYRTAVEAYGRWRSPPETQVLLGNLGGVLWELEKEEEALQTFTERHRLAEEAWPGGHWRVGVAALAVGEYYARIGRPDQAEPWFRETLASYAEALGEDHGWAFNARSLLGAILAQEGKYEEAEPLLIASFEGLFRLEGEENAYTVSARRRLVEMYERWGYPAKAARYRDPRAGSHP